MRVVILRLLHLRFIFFSDGIRVREFGSFGTHSWSRKATKVGYVLVVVSDLYGISCGS